MKNRSIRTLGAVLLSAAMLLGLTACTRGGTSSGGTSPGGVSAGEGNNTPADGIAAKGSKWAEGLTVPELENRKISILLSTSFDEEMERDTEEAPSSLYQTWLTWKETYGEDVEVIKVEWDSFTTYLTTNAAAGSTPDIVYGGTTWFPSWPAKNLVQSLEPYMDFSDSMWRKDIMDQMKWNGQYYVAYAQEPENFYICYNKTKFELAGETTPLEYWQQDKWNWTQFVETAKNMTDIDNDEYGYTGWNLGLSKSIYSLIDVGEDGSVSSLITTPKVKRWFTEIYNFYHTGAARTDNQKGNFLTTFPAGKDAMIHISPEEYVRMQRRLQVTGGDEFEIAPYPIFDPNGETVSKTTTNIYGLSIASHAKNPEGAAAYIKLYYQIMANINNSYGELGLFGSYLSEEEKAAIKEANESTAELNFLHGFGNASSRFQSYVGDVIYSPQKEGSVSSLLDSFESVLNAEIAEFEGSITK